MEQLDFNSDDFSKMTFNMYDVPSGKNPLDFFPKLASRKEFKYKTKIKSDKIIRYVGYVYDKGSPFRVKVDDVKERKIQVARFCGIDVNDDYVVNFMVGGNEKINQMIVAYCRSQNSTQHSLIVALEEQFHRELEAVMQPDYDGKIDIAKTQKLLEDKVNVFFNNDDSTDLKQQYWDIIQEEQVSRLRPEMIARSLRDGVQPITREEIL